MGLLSGKVALVTGGSRGIGRGIALELAKAGCSVIINYRKDKSGAEETLDILNKIGGYAKEEDWDEIINTNLKGVFNCCHSVVPHMLSKGVGSIINISSMWGNVGASCEVIYSASKGGINSFTKALAKELGPSNIRVNAISPGVINTDMNSWLSEEDVNELQQEIPLCKFGECEDIGNTVVFLASDNSKYITGQIITVDGGMV